MPPTKVGQKADRITALFRNAIHVSVSLQVYVYNKKAAALKGVYVMFVVVFHGCYYSTTDNGCRIYKADDQYLADYPSMYSEIARFESLEAASQFCEAQDASQYE